MVDISEEKATNLLSEIVEAHGENKAIYLRADICDASKIDWIFEETINKFKNLDIVINCAGVIDESNWERVYNVNLIASTRVTFRAKEKYIKEHKSGDHGVVLNISSVLGVHNFRAFPSYCATKQALVSLGYCLGSDEHFEETKTRIVTVCPGSVDTPLYNTVVSKYTKTYKEDSLKYGNEEMEHPESVAKCVNNVIQEGRNGSIWVVRNRQPWFEYKYPQNNGICYKK